MKIYDDDDCDEDNLLPFPRGKSDLPETVQMTCNSFFMNLHLRLQSQIRAGLTENYDSRKEKSPAEEF